MQKRTSFLMGRLNVKKRNNFQNQWFVENSQESLEK